MGGWNSIPKITRNVGKAPKFEFVNRKSFWQNFSTVRCLLATFRRPNVEALITSNLCDLHFSPVFEQAIIYRNRHLPCAVWHRLLEAQAVVAALGCSPRKPRLHQIHVAGCKLYLLVSTCIPCRRLHVSCIGDKIVVTSTCIHLYPRVEHCLELVSVYMYPSTCIRRYKLLVRDTCIRLHHFYMYLIRSSASDSFSTIALYKSIYLLTYLLKRDFRYGQPKYIVSTAPVVLRSRWSFACNTFVMARRFHVLWCSRAGRGSSKLSSWSYPVYHVPRWFSCSDWAARFMSASIRGWWHTDIWL